MNNYKRSIISVYRQPIKSLIFFHYGLGIGMVLIAIIVPVMKVVKMSPKKVLL